MKIPLSVASVVNIHVMLPSGKQLRGYDIENCQLIDDFPANIVIFDVSLLDAICYSSPPLVSTYV